MSKLLILVEGLDSGGIENYLLRFLKESSNKFSEIEILCKSGKIGVLEQEFLRVPKIKITKFSLNIFSWGRFYRYLKVIRPNCVVDFTGHFGALPISIARLAKIKNRVVFYRSSTDRFKKAFYKTLIVNFFKYLIRVNSTWILANSESAFINYYPNCFRKDRRFKVIYNGINPLEFQGADSHIAKEIGIKQNDFVIGHIGRLNGAKNHGTILNVAIKLTTEFSNVKFVCCGLNVEKLRASVPDNLKNRILFLPFRRDIKNILNIMNCFYFPSITEGNPNALIEAMLFNIPIVASNIDPIKECMPKQCFDTLVDPYDELGAINLLTEYIEGKPVPIDYRKWALDKFDYKELFDEFLQVIKQ